MKELAKKYNITKKDIALILERYGSLEKFYKEYVEGNISNKDEKRIAERMIKDVIDIDGNPDKEYDNLWRDLIFYEPSVQKRRDMMFYSSQKLQQVVRNLLDEKTKLVVQMQYGIGTKKQNLEEIARQIGLTSKEGARQVSKKFIKKMNTEPKSEMTECCLYDFSSYDEFIRDEERDEIEEIKMDIQLQNGDLSENLEKIKSIYEAVKRRKEITLFNERRTEANRKRKEELKSIFQEDWIPIKELLEYSDLTYGDLLEIGIEPNLAAKHFLEICEYGHQKEGIAEGNLEELLSVRTYNRLNGAGITSLVDLSRMTKEYFVEKVKNMGRTDKRQVDSLMEEKNINFKSEEPQDYISILKYRIEEGRIPIEKLIGLTYENLLEIGITPELATELIKKIEQCTIKQMEQDKLRLDTLCQNKELTKRACNALKEYKITFLTELSGITREQLRRISGLGEKSVSEVEEKMKEYGISFLGEENATTNENPFLENAISYTKEVVGKNEIEEAQGNTIKGFQEKDSSKQVKQPE